jgi:antitoxin component YwqK of YwqJK toxin-antitoxin module
LKDQLSLVLSFYLAFEIMFMKPLLIIILIGLFYTSAAQKKEQYYDYNWKVCEPGNARFYSTVEKTDSGWLRQDYYINGFRLQMRVLYADAEEKIQNGDAIYYHANGIPSSKGRYVQNKLEGLYLRFHPNGMIADSATYHLNMPVGNRILWHPNGYMSDSIHILNDSMQVHVMWFDDGNVAGAGYILNNKQHGKWQYFHRSGQLAGEVVFRAGKAISKNYFNEEGNPQPDTAKANTEAEFKNGGQKGWIKYLEKSAYWPNNTQLVNTTAVTIGVEFTVNEEGKTENVQVFVPFHPQFDEIALRIIRNSPAWKPAVVHNRKMKQKFRQPVTFVQQE